MDVEDFFHVSAFEAQFPRAGWDAVPLRVERGVDSLLALCREHGVRATFFVLGWIAQRRPGLVRRIAAEGHELGCHSLEHHLVYRMQPGEFREDLRAAVGAIEDAAGVSVRAYRAPSFSITSASLWALEVLAAEGITVDSSIYPVRHDRYGLPGAPDRPFRPLPDHPGLVEVPMTTVRWGRLALPCGGGGYLRLYPLAVTRAAIRRVHRRHRRPVVLYVHPWELDPEQPQVSAPWSRRLRHRVNLSRTRERLDRLVRELRPGSLSDLVESLGGPSALPVVDLGRDRSAPP